MGKEPFTFQRAGDGLDETWIVHVRRFLFRGSRRSWPASLVLGTVSLTGHGLTDTVFDVWPQSYYGGVHPKKEARRLLESSEMWASLMVAREAYFREEQETGMLHVVIGGTEHTRWHTYQRASAYASERLAAIWRRGLQVIRRAEISRGLSSSDVKPFLFAAMEVNEYGHERGVSLARTSSADGSWLLTPRASADKAYG